MPFELGEAINSIAERITAAPIVESIARNPIYTALLITFVIVLIIMFIFRDVQGDESLLSLCLRAGFYVSVFLTGALLIHNQALMKETSGVAKDSEVATVFAKEGAYSGIAV